MTQPASCYMDQAPATTTCANCARAVCAEHAVRGQPFITARDLVVTGLRTPAALVGPPLPEVDYCPGCREDLAGRRTGEQLKVLLGAVALLALLGLLVFLLVT